MTEDRDPVLETGPVGEVAEPEVEVSEESAPVEAQGQPDEQSVTDGFFDPKELPEELMPAYKQMQASYTRKTQEIAAQRRKVEAYDAFMANPQASIQQMAQQYGLTIAQAQEAQQAAQEQLPEEPQSWADVRSWIANAEKNAVEKAKAELMRQYEPVVNEVRGWKKNQIEQQLDAEFPQWRDYESQMSQVLQQHPSLVSDPSTLLRVAIPREVQESAATKRAIDKLQRKAEGARVSSGSSTNRQKSNMPNGPVSFQDAVEYAKRSLADKGIRPN